MGVIWMVCSLKLLTGALRRYDFPSRLLELSEKTIVQRLDASNFCRSPEMIAHITCNEYSNVVAIRNSVCGVDITCLLFVSQAKCICVARVIILPVWAVLK